jgi:hypothetical protein
VLQIGAAKARTKINNRTDDELSEHQAELPMWASNVQTDSLDNYYVLNIYNNGMKSIPYDSNFQYYVE